MEDFSGFGLSPELLVLVAAVGILPFIVVSATAFVKIAVVFALVRNALGIQQIPPNIVIYGLALTVTIYIMLPVITEVAMIVTRLEQNGENIGLIVIDAAAPIGNFLERHTEASHIQFFQENVQRVWQNRVDPGPELTRLLTLLPAFTTSELTQAFEIGFLIYLPFIAIDLVVANILLALGMMMLSPVTISLPFKLFLFVAVSGWTKLVQSLVLGYAS